MNDKLVIRVFLVVGLGFLIWFGIAITPRDSLTEASGPEYEARLAAAEALFAREPDRLAPLERRVRRAMDRAIDKVKLDLTEPTPEQAEGLQALADQGYETAIAASKAEALKFRALNYQVAELNAMGVGSWALHLQIRNQIKQQTLISETAAYREILKNIRDDAADQVFCEGRDLVSGFGQSTSDCVQ
ncbi:MAG: hypothetical protein AAGH74_05835 [Pseudomonadota bacterium]